MPGNNSQSLSSASVLSKKTVNTALNLLQQAHANGLLSKIGNAASGAISNYFSNSNKPVIHKASRSRRSNGLAGHSELSRAVRPSRVVTAPMNVGSFLPSVHFTLSGTANRIADQDNSGSLKIRGCTLLQDPVTFTNYVSPPAVTFSSGGFFGRGAEYFDLHSLDSRFRSILDMYSWYAIRRLNVHYVPLLGTSSPGNVSYGVVSDVVSALRNWSSANCEANFENSSLQSDILASQFSNSGPVWAPNSMVLHNKGAKCYPTDFQISDKLDINDTFEFAIVCMVSGSNAAGQSTGKPSTVGQFYIEYEVDFYMPACYSTFARQMTRPTIKEVRDFLHREASRGREQSPPSLQSEYIGISTEHKQGEPCSNPSTFPRTESTQTGGNYQYGSRGVGTPR